MAFKNILPVNNTEIIKTHPFPIRNETSVTTGAGTYSEILIKAKRRIKIVIYCFCDFIDLDL